MSVLRSVSCKAAPCRLQWQSEKRLEGYEWIRSKRGRSSARSEQSRASPGARLRKSSASAIRRCRNGNAAAARPMEHGHPISFPAGDTLPLKRLHKKKRRGNVAFLEEMKRKTTAGQPSEKRRSAACRAYYMKNGRFAWEPSVLCSAFVIPAEAGKSCCPEREPLLLLFF